MSARLNTTGRRAVVRVRGRSWHEVDGKHVHKHQFANTGKDQRGNARAVRRIKYAHINAGQLMHRDRRSHSPNSPPREWSPAAGPRPAESFTPALSPSNNLRSAESRSVRRRA